MPAPRDILLGVDLGTSSVKVVAFDLDGKALASASRDYPLSTPKPNWSEQSPEDWWRATVAALAAVVKRIDASRVSGVSFSGQMHGSVFLDRNGEVIRPCILWNDGRTARECDEILERVGRNTFLSTIKNLPLVSFTLPKLLWLRNHEKGNFRKLYKVLLPKDYVRYRLTGAMCIDEADAAGTVMMEVGRKRWATRILDALELDPALLPVLQHSTDVVGQVTTKAARQTGLKPGTLVVAGAGDQPAGATGVGVFREGQVMISLGTSGVVFAPTREAHIAGENGLASFDHAVPGVSYLMGCVMSASGALEWYRTVMCGAEESEARRADQSVFDLLLRRAAAVPPGAEDLLFLPYLTGERTPHNNPDARAVFLGLSPRHGKEHLTRSVIEGICFALRDCLELIKAKGVPVEEIRATGGGARNTFWLQTLADIFGMPVRRVENPEGGALGAAILAGVGTGAYRDFQQAERRAIRAGRPIKPNARRTAAYQPIYERFRAAYPAVAPLFVKH